MGFFDKLFSRQPKRSSDVGLGGMVEMLHILVIPSYQAFLEQFPRLREVTTDQYDFVMTNAAVTAALMGIESLKPMQFEEAKQHADVGLRKIWSEDGPQAVADCWEFVNKGLSGQDIENVRDALSGALGMWIVWNLFRVRPADDDLPLISATGRMAFHLSSTFWA